MKLQLVAKNFKKLKGGPFGDMKKFPKKTFLMRFLNSVTVPKNVKGGTLCNFLTSIVLQNIKKIEGGPFGEKYSIQKVSKRRIVPKKSGGILSVISRLWTSVLFFLFVLDALLSLELLRFDVVEV